MLKNMGQFLKEDVAISLQIIFTGFFVLRTTKPFIAFLICYTTLKYTNMKGVKRKTEQPTLAAFAFTKKVIHSG